MTSYLRLFLLALVGMVCLGASAQSEVTIWEENWSGVQGGTTPDKVKDYYTYENGTGPVRIVNSNNAGGDAPELYISRAGKLSVALDNLKKCAGDLILTFKANQDLWNLQVNGDTVAVTSEGNNRTAIINITKGTKSLKLQFTGAAEGTTFVDDIKLVGTPAPKDSSSLLFAGLSGTGVLLVNSALNGSAFTGYTATEKNNIEGTITYTSSNPSVATVDESTGQVTTSGVYGSTVIQATFTPADEEDYLPSTAQYTITNKHLIVYNSVASMRIDMNNGTLAENSDEFIQVAILSGKVLYKHEWTSNEVKQVRYFIREGSGEAATAFCLYNPGVTISNSAQLSGTYTGKIYNHDGMLCLTQCDITSADALTVKSSTAKATPLEISTANAYKHICDLVAVKGAAVSQSGSSIVLSNDATADDMVTYSNQFAPKTASLYSPYTGANVDLTSAIVIPSTAGSAYAEYQLAPTDENTVIYNFAESNALTATAAQADVPVLLNRTFVLDEWNTLCLPFALTAAQVTEMFGSDVQLRTLSAVDGNTLTFAEATALEAQQPCLIKLGIIASNNTYTTTHATIVAHTDGATRYTPTAGSTAMVGIYQLTDITTDATGTPLFLGDGNKFYQAQSGSKMKGFRAYFDVPASTDADKVQAVIDGQTTSIDTLNSDVVNANARIYNLNGQCVGTSLQQLQPGIYIQHGKKVIIR